MNYKADLATHRPVGIKFHAGALRLRHLQISNPQALPKTKPFGPSPPPRCWKAAAAAAEAADEAAKNQTRYAAQKALDKAYQIFIDDLELEVAQITGTTLKKPGQRGKHPETKWVKPRSKAAPEPTLEQANAHVWRWLAQTAADLFNIVKRCVASGGAVRKDNKVETIRENSHTKAAQRRDQRQV